LVFARIFYLLLKVGTGVGRSLKMSAKYINGFVWCGIFLCIGAEAFCPAKSHSVFSG